MREYTPGSALPENVHHERRRNCSVVTSSERPEVEEGYGDCSVWLSISVIAFIVSIAVIVRVADDCIPTSQGRCESSMLTFTAGLVGLVGGIYGARKCQRCWSKEGPEAMPPQPCGRRCQARVWYWPCEYVCELTKNHPGYCTCALHLGRGPEPTPVDGLGRGGDMDPRDALYLYDAKGVSFN